MDMMTEEILQALEPEILALAPFYTHIMKQELIKVANEFKDNEDERKATDDVINTIEAVVKVEGSIISLSFECHNEVWLEIINDGLEATDVTGGKIKLPQGGTRESEAAIIGGKFEGAKEIATLAKDNAVKIINSVMQEDLNDLMHSDFVIAMIKGRISKEISNILGGDAS